MHSFITDIGTAIIVATVMGILAHRLKQPIVLAYLIAGIIIGPEFGASFIQEKENIEVISEIGLILLLFIIGLEMNPSHLKKEFRSLLAPGIMQFPLVAAVSFLTLLGIGFGYATENLDLLYLAVGLSFSSTAIVVKILTDKFELNTLSGKASVGMLIFQDLWAILFLALQPNLTNPEIFHVLLALSRVALLLASGLIVSRFVLKPLFETFKLAPEMLVSIGLGWCAVMAGYGKTIDLSMEMGALIAGVTLSSFPYGVHITSKVAPLRDFFLTLFFISLGMEIPFPQGELLGDAFIIVVLALVARPLLFYPLLRLGGSGKRTAFVTSLNLAQISEFALVIASIGFKFSHISEHTLSTLLYAMSITSILGSYIIKYNRQIFRAYERFTFLLGAKNETDAPEPAEDVRTITILGYHRGAHALIHCLTQIKPEILNKIQVIDFNSEYKKELTTLGIRFLISDISSAEALEHANIRQSDMIISTIPDFLLKGTDNEKLVRQCRVLSPNAFIYANADFVTQIDKIMAAGANQVILPYALAGEIIAGDIIRLFEKFNPAKEA